MSDPSKHRSSAARPLRPDPGSAAMAASESGPSVIIGLNAVIVAVGDEIPAVLVVKRPTPDNGSEQNSSFGLPFGPFDPVMHRTLEIGLRTWVASK